MQAKQLPRACRTVRPPIMTSSPCSSCPPRLLRTSSSRSSPCSMGKQLCSCLRREHRQPPAPMPRLLAHRTHPLGRLLVCALSPAASVTVVILSDCSRHLNPCLLQGARNPATLAPPQCLSRKNQRPVVQGPRRPPPLPPALMVHSGAFKMQSASASKQEISDVAAVAAGDRTDDPLQELPVADVTSGTRNGLVCSQL